MVRLYAPENPLLYEGFYNGKANGGSSITQFSSIERELISPCIRAERHITYTTEELDYILGKRKKVIPHLVAIGGGDGTQHRIITEMYNTWGRGPEMFVLLSLGTQNLVCASYGLGGGVRDKLFREWGIPTVPVNLARSIREAVEKGVNPTTVPFKILDANGEKGSILGFGGVPKIMWKYYRKTQDQYARLTERLGNARPEEYARVLTEIWDEPQLVEEVKKSIPFGLGNLSTKIIGNGLETTITGLFDLLDREKREHYVQPLPFKVYIDGERIDVKEAHSIFISTIKRLKVGPGFSIYPLNEDVKDPERFPLLFCSHTIRELFEHVGNLDLVRGKKLPKNNYYQPKELTLVSDQPIVAQVDGDFVVMDKEVHVTVGDVSKLVILPKN